LVESLGLFDEKEKQRRLKLGCGRVEIKPHFGVDSTRYKEQIEFPTVGEQKVCENFLFS
jgi:hypothetical protein